MGGKLVEQYASPRVALRVWQPWLSQGARPLRGRAERGPGKLAVRGPAIPRCVPGEPCSGPNCSLNLWLLLIGRNSFILRKNERTQTNYLSTSIISGYYGRNKFRLQRLCHRVCLRGEYPQMSRRTLLAYKDSIFVNLIPNILSQLRFFISQNQFTIKMP